MTRDEMHIKALSKGIDSQTIKGSMTVILLGHAVDMMMEMQDAHEAELKAKDDEIARLEKVAKDKYEYHTELTDKWAKECNKKDERIAKLEAMIEKMKCCENCSFYPPQKCCFDTQYGCLDGLIPTNWKIKGTNNE